MIAWPDISCRMSTWESPKNWFEKILKGKTNSGSGERRLPTWAQTDPKPGVKHTQWGQMGVSFIISTSTYHPLPTSSQKFLKKSNQALQWTKFLEFWIQVSVARSPRSRKDFFEFLKKYSGVCRHNNLFLCPWGLLGKAKGLPWRSGGLNQSWKLYIFVTLSYFGGKSPLNDSLYLILLFLSVVICFLPVKSVVSETVQCVE